jgi:hypothetical protein
MLENYVFKPCKFERDAEFSRVVLMRGFIVARRQKHSAASHNSILLHVAIRSVFEHPVVYFLLDL